MIIFDNEQWLDNRQAEGLQCACMLVTHYNTPFTKDLWGGGGIYTTIHKQHEFAHVSNVT